MKLQTQFNEMKLALMSDIQDRCQRVVETEIELDSLQEETGRTRANNGMGIRGKSTNNGSSTAAVAQQQQQQQSQDKIRALQKDSLDMTYEDSRFEKRPHHGARTTSSDPRAVPPAGHRKSKNIATLCTR